MKCIDVRHVRRCISVCVHMYKVRVKSLKLPGGAQCGPTDGGAGRTLRDFLCMSRRWCWIGRSFRSSSWGSFEKAFGLKMSRWTAPAGEPDFDKANMSWTRVTATLRRCWQILACHRSLAAKPSSLYASILRAACVQEAGLYPSFARS